MIVDFDDFTEADNRLDLLATLRNANPRFRCTLFAIPALGSDEFWESVPDWCELAMHGWAHPHPREAEAWNYQQARALLSARPARFVKGFKAPGWQISDGTYRALMDMDWWVADHWENEGRRPEGLRAHVIAPDYRTTGDHLHGHIGNVCGNGIAETFPELLERVKAADSFELISEVAA
jgi:hypothetical protein